MFQFFNLRKFALEPNKFWTKVLIHFKKRKLYQGFINRMPDITYDYGLILWNDP